MDIMPSPPEDRQVIEGYGDGRFRVSGEVFAGSILVFPERTVEWPVAAFADLSAESLAPVLSAEPPVEVLLLGCGRSAARVSKALRERLRAAGVAVEEMDTGAACRTYNVLVLEERRVAAALISVA